MRHGFQVDTLQYQEDPHLLCNHKKTNKKEYSEEFLQWWNRLITRNDGSKIKAICGKKLQTKR